MSSDEEIEKPPERRAPSSRASKGSRMQKLIAQEEDEDEADQNFYEQEFWAEAEGDAEYDAENEEQAGDSFDSDFGDSTDDDDDDDEEAAEQKRAKQKDKIARKKSVYSDPKLKEKRAPAEKKSHKRQRVEGGAIAAPTVFNRSSLRGSTQEHTAAQAAKRERDEQRQKVREERRAQLGKSKGVELRRLTQEEILAEARQTEIINRASLEKMLRIEEEKRKVDVRDKDVSGPRVKFRSTRRGDSVLSTVSFVECDVPAAINAIAPPYPVPPRCAVSGLPAKFFDSVTNQPYATLEAFRMLRGRTGRRSSFAGLAAGGPSDATPAAEAT